MNILVFIKEVADTEARIVISGDRKALEIENKYAINFFDEFAIEEAVRIKERIERDPDNNLHLRAFRAIEALRTAIAMGADRAFLIDSSKYESDDPLSIAEMLASFAKKEGFDLIFCGKQAIDDENANIGPMTAEFLNIPHVAGLRSLKSLTAVKLGLRMKSKGVNKSLK